jgi:hypothetical protein
MWAAGFAIEAMAMSSRTTPPRAQGQMRRFFGGGGGQFEVSVGGEVMPPLESVRAESVLAYLLLHRAAAVSRQRLASLFWPDSMEAQARTKLSNNHAARRHIYVDVHGRQTCRELRNALVSSSAASRIGSGS